jgi:hypothetical protein
VKALRAAGSAHAIALVWLGIGLGAGTVALGAGYICLDAFDALTDKVRGWLPYLLIPGAAALIASGLFAWLQPGGPARRAADLPGMASVTGWTALAIAVVVAVALISMLPRPATAGTGRFLGHAHAGPAPCICRRRGDLGGAPGGRGDQRRDRGFVPSPGEITCIRDHRGVPLLVWAAVLAVVAFGLASHPVAALRCRRRRRTATMRRPSGTR